MAQVYSDPERENDPHALPDIEVFQMTAEEVATSGDYEDELWEITKRREFRLANMNSRDRQAAIDCLIEEQGITGGWYWHACFPGCLPDGERNGPFESKAAAIADAQDSAK